MDQLKNKKILLIDNYDSFTYNLMQQISSIGVSVEVIRNDKIDLLKQAEFTHLIISPGPKDPSDAGFCFEMILKYAGQKPILGVCLGHQIIGQLYGAKISQASYPVHGKTAKIIHDQKGLFENMPQGFLAARYHSLVVDSESFPSCFKVSAHYNNMIMGIEHKEISNLYGVQFHPESFLTEQGDTLIRNFLSKVCY